MRGASAVQQLLERHADERVRVFVVWEPVILTDIAPPTSGVLGLLSDRRVRQYWDADRLLSRNIVSLAIADAAKTGREVELDAESIVWDFVAIYPAGARWGRALPEYHGYPVVEVLEEFERRLAERIAVSPARSVQLSSPQAGASSASASACRASRNTLCPWETSTLSTVRSSKARSERRNPCV